MIKKKKCEEPTSEYQNLKVMTTTAAWKELDVFRSKLDIPPKLI